MACNQVRLRFKVHRAKRHKVIHSHRRQTLIGHPSNVEYKSEISQAEPSSLVGGCTTARSGIGMYRCSLVCHVPQVPSSRIDRVLSVNYPSGVMRGSVYSGRRRRRRRGRRRRSKPDSSRRVLSRLGGGRTSPDIRSIHSIY